MKGVLWVRVSTSEQDRGFSPDAQLRTLRETAEKHSIQIIKEFRVAESAKTSESRKQFKGLIEFIREHKPDYLIAFAVDRITRNPRDLSTINDLIEKENIRVLVANENREINKNSSPADKFAFMINGSTAYYWNLQNAERTKMSMLEKARRGIFPSRAPVGYLNVPDPSDPIGRKRMISLDPVKGPLVRLAFELYAKGGYSLATLRNELNRRGLHASPSAKRPKSPMSIYGLQVILGNPFYYGMVRWDKQIFKGTHEPLISADLFNRVQARLSENRSYMRPASKKYFAFKPFLKCGYCRSSITAEEQQGQRGKGHYIYYRCTYGKERDRETKGRKCPQGYFREEKIDEMFAEALEISTLTSQSPTNSGNC